MWSLMAVNEKKEEGGGLGPVVGGEDHSPAKDVVFMALSFPDSSLQSYGLVMQ